ncbi:hypothetical protein [Photobacterium kishitanii]|uniref:Uncharacterized protein n=1 Tax=Photobacterium kishitanii TaxID=318456 RepID=A0A2T3KMS5_9GAMM|nr:hypothetical protein [Photobacterium kishitanii]PSV01103.1 hypothetical protein C9J27_03530 [Photobacterium kishitanii]
MSIYNFNRAGGITKVSAVPFDSASFDRSAKNNKSRQTDNVVALSKGEQINNELKLALSAVKYRKLNESTESMSPDERISELIYFLIF